MRGIARHSHRTLRFSIAAFCLVLVICASLAWAWIEYVPPASGRPRYVSASPAYAEALTLMRDIYRLPKPPHPQFPPGSTAPLKETRARWQGLLKRIHALHNGDWRAHRSWAFDDLKSAGAEQGSWILGYSQVVAVECELLRKESRNQEALGLALDGLTTHSKLAHGANLVHRIFAIHAHRIIFKQVEQLLSSHVRVDWRQALLRSRAIARSWPAVAEAEGLDGTPAWDFTRTVLEDFRRQSLPERIRSLRDLGVTRPGEVLRALVTPRSVSLAALADYERERVTQLRRPFSLRQDLPPPADPWVLSGGSDVSLFTVTHSELQTTDLALLEVVLAALVFQERAGRVPDSLTEMAPDLVPEVPLDQWDAPVQYRLKAGEPLVYSLGPDGDDDGGRPISASEAREPGADGDRVFGHLVRARPLTPPKTKGEF